MLFLRVKDEKCNIAFLRRIGIAKDSPQKLKALRQDIFAIIKSTEFVLYIHFFVALRGEQFTHR